MAKLVLKPNLSKSGNAGTIRRLQNETESQDSMNSRHRRSQEAGGHLRRIIMSVATVTVAWLIAIPSLAQVSGLTPEQQRMLDQLPPSEREQALKVLRQQPTKDSGSNRIEPVREEEAAPPTDSSEVAAPETGKPSAQAGES